jgi:hypothetical protein
MIRRLLICCALLLPLTMEAQAAPRDEMVSGFYRCTSIADNRTFLDCVYGAAQPLRAELGLAPASPAQVALVPPNIAAAPMARPLSGAPPPSAAPRPSNPGFFGRLVGTGDIVTPPTAMASYAITHDGAFIVTLKNGQVWRQNDDGDIAVNWRKPASSYIVTVIQGALGSFSMQVSGEPTSYKVTRLH